MKILSFEFDKATLDGSLFAQVSIQFSMEDVAATVTIDYDRFYSWCKSNTELSKHGERSEDGSWELDTYVIESEVSCSEVLQEELLKDVMRMR